MVSTPPPPLPARPICCPPCLRAALPVGWASAPASSANLGPGFDVLALALGLRCAVRVAPTGEWALASAGADAGSLALVRRAAEAAAGGWGPFAVEVESAIPVGRGLGSSAALVVGVVAAVRAAAGLAREPGGGGAGRRRGGGPRRQRGRRGARRGGGGQPRRAGLRPGGASFAAGAGGGPCRDAAHRRGPGGAAGPHRHRHRGPHRGRAWPSWWRGCAGAMPPLLAEAAGDELHEKRRAHLSPLTGALVAAARDAGAAHAAWSGAGPSAVALVGDDAAAAVRAAWEGLLAGRAARSWSRAWTAQGLRRRPPA